MSKLGEIAFKPIITKEVECFGHKVTLRSITTKDNIELDIRLEDAASMAVKDMLILGLKILSRAIIVVDGIIPDNPEDVRVFLEKQDTSVVFDLLNKYQEMVSVTPAEIKN